MNIFRAYKLLRFTPRIEVCHYRWTYESYPMTLTPLDKI